MFEFPPTHPFRAQRPESMPAMKSPLQRLLRAPLRVARIAARELARQRRRLGGHAYVVEHLVRSPLAGTGAHEEWLDFVLRAAFACKPGTFIDVGANIGVTLLQVLAIDPERRYLGFEPDPSTGFWTEQFIRTNQLPNHAVIPIGLSTEFGVLKLRYRGIDGAATVVEGFRPDDFYVGEKLVFVAPGDFVIRNLGVEDVAALTVDVEGGELEVIEGLKDTISRHQPFIVFEVLPNHLAITNRPLDDETVSFRMERLERLERALREHGYAIFRVEPEHTLSRLDRIDPGSEADMSRANYVAVPSALESAFLARIG